MPEQSMIVCCNTTQSQNESLKKGRHFNSSKEQKVELTAMIDKYKEIETKNTDVMKLISKTIDLVAKKKKS